MNKKNILIIISLIVAFGAGALSMYFLDDFIDNKKHEIIKKYDDISANGYNENYIGKEKAKEIALLKANLNENDVRFVKVELDLERGIPVYDVEFKSGFKEYSTEIKADDGTILEWDMDID